MYDKAQGHKVIVGKGIPTVIVQRGKIYENNSGRSLGGVEMLIKDISVEKLRYLTCKLDGATFPTLAGLTRWLYDRHRDHLINRAMKMRPKDYDGAWIPGEDMLYKEAQKMANEARPKDKEGNEKNVPEAKKPSREENVVEKVESSKKKGEKKSHRKAR